MKRKDLSKAELSCLEFYESHKNERLVIKRGDVEVDITDLLGGYLPIGIRSPFGDSFLLSITLEGNDDDLHRVLDMINGEGNE